jgi:hypothetical protein
MSRVTSSAVLIGQRYSANWALVRNVETKHNNAWYCQLITSQVKSGLRMLLLKSMR